MEIEGYCFLAGMSVMLVWMPILGVWSGWKGKIDN